MRRTTIRTWCIGIALGVFATGCSQLVELPVVGPGDLRFDPHQTTKVIDVSGRKIAELHAREDRTVIPLRSIPGFVRRAVIAIEDRRFFEHDGVDLKAIARAASENIASGRIEEGGSTITQQYVRNTLIGARERSLKTFERKLDEIALARQIERRLDKREILQRYLNTVYFGHGAYGVQAAARTMFRRPVWKLTLGQAATLAGVIKSPEYYDPFDHPRRARERRNLVLREMLELGYIDERTADKAVRQPLRLGRLPNDLEYRAPYFVDYVKRFLLYDPRFDMLGDTVQERSRALITGGLKIHTTLDSEMQRAAEDAVRSILPYPDDPHASVVAIDPATGEVRAMVGGRDFFARKKKDPYAKLNLAISGEPGLGSSSAPDSPALESRAPGTGRQAGSAFKPFALATAIQEGVSLNSTYPAGACMEFPEVNAGEPWRVCNYEESAFGSVSLLTATASSINVVYAQLILDIGAEDVARTARKMGIRTPLVGVPSAALGTNPVNPLGMASAYGTLAAGGVHAAPSPIKKIVSAAGEVLYKHKPARKRAIDATTAYLTTRALETVMTSGTGTGAQIGRPAAGKTGTAQEYRDAWFVGYTPELVASVWVGYPSASIEMKTYCSNPDPNVCRPTRITVAGGTWPAMIWRAFMSVALQDVPASSFEVPEDASITVLVDTRTGCLANDYTPEAYVSEQTFPLGAEPTSSCSLSPPDDDDEEEEEEEEGGGPPEDRGPPDEHPGQGRGNDKDDD